MDAKVRSALTTALYKLFKPLIQILIRNGVSYPMVADVLKRCFLDVAAQQCNTVSGKRASAARLALLTGIHRKDIARLRSGPDLSQDTRWELQNYLARLVLTWNSDPLYCDAKGRPREIPVLGDAPSFHALAIATTSDVPMVTTLDELISNGCVQRVGDDRVKLLSSVYYPAQGEREKLWVLGNAGADLYSTIGHNLAHTGKDSRYQSYVFFDNLPDEVMQQIRERANQTTDKFLKETLEWLRAYDRDENPTVTGSGRNRAGIGAYFFHDDVSREEE